MHPRDGDRLLKDLADRGPYGRHFAADVTFTTIETGQVIAGRAAIERFIRYFHEDAFDARARVSSAVVDAGRAAVELEFSGAHTGEFMGIAATGQAINVPCGIVYDVRGDQIAALRGYLPLALLLQQIGAFQISNGAGGSQQVMEFSPQWVEKFNQSQN